jgi:hypothetical protein
LLDGMKFSRFHHFSLQLGEQHDFPRTKSPTSSPTSSTHLQYPVTHPRRSDVAVLVTSVRDSASAPSEVMPAAVLGKAWQAGNFPRRDCGWRSLATPGFILRLFALHRIAPSRSHALQASSNCLCACLAAPGLTIVLSSAR